MITKNTSYTNATKMQKYIVEAPLPKEGQKLSSGGIREKGKLATQYKNPVPYEESTSAQMNTIPTSLKNDAINIGKMILLDFSKMLWQEFIFPVARAKLHQSSQHLITYIDSAPVSQQSFADSDVNNKSTLIVDAETYNVKTNDTNTASKIIKFDNKKKDEIKSLNYR
jgi:hypothetical protein